MPLNLLTDVAGIAVGHATDLALGSGVTAILFDSAGHRVGVPCWAARRADAIPPCWSRK